MHKTEIPIVFEVVNVTEGRNGTEGRVARLSMMGVPLVTKPIYTDEYDVEFVKELLVKQLVDRLYAAG